MTLLVGLVGGIVFLFVAELALVAFLLLVYRRPKDDDWPDSQDQMK